MDNFNLITNMNKFTLFLHKYIYIDSANIEILEQCLCSQFDISSVSFTYAPLRFELKIKKTNIKKDKNYSHSASFYYDRIDEAFRMFFSNQKICIDINNHINDIDNSFEREIIDMIFKRILNPVGDFKPISLIYTVTTILDNVILINI